MPLLITLSLPMLLNPTLYSHCPSTHILITLSHGGGGYFSRQDWRGPGSSGCCNDEIYVVVDLHI